MTPSPSTTLRSFLTQHGNCWAPNMGDESRRLMPLLKAAKLKPTRASVTTTLYKMRKHTAKPAPTPNLTPLTPTDQASDAGILEDIGAARTRLAGLAGMLKTYTDETTAMLDRLHAETEARRLRLEQLRQVINNGDAHA